MRLLDLCNEILLTIISILPNDALVKFSCTCREVCELTSSQRKIQKYTALYSKLKLDAHYSSRRPWLHPIQVMKKIHQDPSIAQYIRKIHYIPPLRCDLNTNPSANDGDESYATLDTAIDKVPFLDDLEKQEWKEAVRKRLVCLANISFVILLSSCTKVTTLTLTGPTTLLKYLNPLVRYLCDNYHESLQELKASHDDSISSNQLLPVLTTLGLCYPGDHAELAQENDLTLFAIPTLRKLYLDKLAVQYYKTWNHWVRTSEYNTSCSCETVNIVRGIPGPQELIGVVESLPRLKKLKYSCFYAFHGSSYVWSENDFIHRCWQFGIDLSRQRSLQMSFYEDRGKLIIEFDELHNLERVTEPRYNVVEGINCRFADHVMIAND